MKRIRFSLALLLLLLVGLLLHQVFQPDPSSRNTAVDRQELMPPRRPGMAESRRHSTYNIPELPMIRGKKPSKPEPESKIAPETPSAAPQSILASETKGSSASGATAGLSFGYYFSKQVIGEEPTDEAIKRLGDAVKAAGLARGVDFVFDAQTHGSRGFPVILYGRESLDLTKEVLRHYQRLYDAD